MNEQRPRSAEDAPELWTDANKLRLLALWFDKWDATDYADRQVLLDEGPGRNDVQRDLRAIAERLDALAAAPSPGPDLREALEKVWPKNERGHDLAVWHPAEVVALLSATPRTEASDQRPADCEHSPSSDVHRAATPRTEASDD